jgi:hypothetical protein
VAVEELAEHVKRVERVGVGGLCALLVQGAQPVDVIVLSQQVDQLGERRSSPLGVPGIDEPLPEGLGPADVSSMVEQV